ncbi:uncharacterized protein RSE6_12250 [Rhynchosporium secalis]|uniref:Uncharacterized protein n=1 Tax=Rhynchosporium secalis TaxID=38038 RepID=A0A1E1MQ10_RHYSE|nr:uncharacterized protein RSE6_12250 [Rhynchosporium secalis]
MPLHLFKIDRNEGPFGFVSNKMQIQGTQEIGQ